MYGASYVALATINVLAPRRTILDAVRAWVRYSTAPVPCAASSLLDIVHLCDLAGWTCKDVGGQQDGNVQEDGGEAHVGGLAE